MSGGGLLVEERRVVGILAPSGRATTVANEGYEIGGGRAAAYAASAEGVAASPLASAAAPARLMPQLAQ